MVYNIRSRTIKPRGANVAVFGEQALGVESSVEVAVGEVRERARQQVELGSGGSYTRRLVAVGDLSDAYPDERETFNQYLDELNQLAVQHKDEWEVPTEENNYKTNPSRSMFYSRFPGSETMRAWQKDIMKAKALYPLQKPHDAIRVLPDGVDDYAMNVFMFAKDSIGIRTRAAVMKQVAYETMKGIEDPEVAVLSLGSGAAVPLIDAVSSIRDSLDKTVKMELCDLSGESLALAAELMHEANIPAEDVVDSYEGHFIRKLHEMKKRSARVDMIEALGLFEYLEDKAASDLLRNSYELLKPGGVIILSNMLSNRPQLEFNQYGVGWPDVVPVSYTH